MDDLRILDAWVAGLRQPAARQLVMLAAGYPDLPADCLAELPVGRANQLLLRDRQATFGTTVEGEAPCPACQQRLEVTVDLAGLLDPGPPEPPEPADPVEVRAGGVVLRCRQANAGDLAAAAGCATPAEASALLLRRCMLAARRGDEPIAPDALPADLMAALDAELSRRDPYADLRLSIHCASCGGSFELVLDPVALYWAELAVRAGRLLSDVHRLASVYGWTESEILRLDPVRRAGYLELIG